MNDVFHKFRQWDGFDFGRTHLSSGGALQKAEQEHPDLMLIKAVQGIDEDALPPEILLKTYGKIKSLYGRVAGKEGWPAWDDLTSESAEKKAEESKEKTKLGEGFEHPKGGKTLGKLESERYTAAKRRLAGFAGQKTSGWGLYGRSIVPAAEAKLEGKKEEPERKAASLDDVSVDLLKGCGAPAPEDGKRKKKAANPLEAAAMKAAEEQGMPGYAKSDDVAPPAMLKSLPFTGAGDDWFMKSAVTDTGVLLDASQVIEDNRRADELEKSALIEELAGELPDLLMKSDEEGAVGSMAKKIKGKMQGLSDADAQRMAKKALAMKKKKDGGDEDDEGEETEKSNGDEAGEDEGETKKPEMSESQKEEQREKAKGSKPSVARLKDSGLGQGGPGRGGNPKTEGERKATHQARFGNTNTPARGTGQGGGY